MAVMTPDYGHPELRLQWVKLAYDPFRYLEGRSPKPYLEWLAKRGLGPLNHDPGDEDRS